MTTKTFFNDKYVNYDQKVTYAVFNNTFITQSNKYYLEVMLITAISFLIWLRMNMGDSFESLIPLLSFYAIAGFRIIPSVNRLINATQTFKFGEASIDIIADFF